MALLQEQVEGTYVSNVYLAKEPLPKLVVEQLEDMKGAFVADRISDMARIPQISDVMLEVILHLPVFRFVEEDVFELI